MTDRPIECRVVLTDTDFIMRNHRVHGVPVMPGVTFLDILLRILRSQGLDHERAVFGRILFTEAVATTEGMDREIRIIIGATDGAGERPVTVDSRWSAVPGSPWRQNLTAVLSFDSFDGYPVGTAQPETIDVGALRAGAVRTTDMAELYARARDEDIRHGPAMACHGPLHVGDGYLLAELSTGAAAPDAADFHLHPALLDAATIAAYGQTEAVSREPFIPMHIDRFRAPRPLGRKMYLYVPGVERLADSGDVIRSDYGLYDEHGVLAAEFGALTCKRIRRPDLITRLLDEPTAWRDAGDAGVGADALTAPETAMGAEAVRAADPVTAYTAHVRRLIGDALGVDPAAVDSGTGFYELGLDSADLVRISGLLEEVVGSSLYPTLLFEFTHINSLATHLAETYPQGATALRSPGADPAASGAASAGSGLSAGALPPSGGGRAASASGPSAAALPSPGAEPAASGVTPTEAGSSAVAPPAPGAEAAALGAAAAGSGLSAAALLASGGGRAVSGVAPGESGLSAVAPPAPEAGAAVFGVAPAGSGLSAAALLASGEGRAASGVAPGEFGLSAAALPSPAGEAVAFGVAHAESGSSAGAPPAPGGGAAVLGAAAAGSGLSAAAPPTPGAGAVAFDVAHAESGSSAGAPPAPGIGAAALGSSSAGSGLSAAALLASGGGRDASGGAPAASGLSAAVPPAAGGERAGSGAGPSASGPSATALFRPRWYEAPATTHTPPGGDLVVFAPDGEPDGLTAELAALATGASVVHVGPGPVFEEAGAARYRLDAADPAQLDLLWSALDARGVRPAALVVPAALAGATGPDAPALTLLRLARSVTGRPAAHPVPAIFFVHPAQDGGAAPEHLAVGALARCVTAEAPALLCRAVGVDRWTAGAVATAVLAELAAGGGGPQSRHIAGRRELRGLAPATATDPDSALTFKRHGVYVVTGGAGALASTLATHLAARYAARIALIGRRPMDDGLAARTDTWRALGAEVAYLTADVTRPADVEAALALVRERFGPIDGVFHTAGVTADSLFRTKPDAAPTAVVLPKALGALNLDRATAGDPLDLFVLYSSLSASQATAGQSDYAFANAWLEHFAEARSARADRPGRTHAIGWPMWAEGGMRLTPDAIAHSRRTRGTWPMPTPEGLELLERVLSGPEGVSVAVYGSPDRVARPFTDADTAPYPQVPDQRPPYEQAPDQAPDQGLHQARHQARHQAPDLVADPTPAPAPSAATAVASAPAPAPAPAPETDAVAIIGLAGQYPQAPDLDAYWRNLAEGRDSITTVPEERWDHSGYFAPERGRPGSTYGRWGGFLDGVDLFDREFFGISRRDAERMDPQERLFLTVCWRTLEDAGRPSHTLRGETVGVFAGVMWNHYQLFQDRGVAPTAMHAAVPNRVSYTFGLTGPSMAVDTACSSSLTAIHLAVESLRRGETSLALAGGVNVTVHPQKYLQLAQGQFLSDDGRCRSFGAGATGYVPGEGVGAVLLKPLRRALADGDHIHGVIRASAANHSGRTSGFTVPSPDSQAVLIRTALHRSGVDPRTIGYIEAHGTGTSLGDPVEIEGLRQAFAGTGAAADGGVAVGSVKSNIGHLESAAGIAALTKVLLQLRYGRLVPSLHSREPNPHLDLAGSPLRIQSDAAEWPRPADGSPRRAGISAFGAGGAGAHLVVEGYDGAARPPAGTGGPLLFVLSAPDPAGLRAYAHALRAHLDAGPGPAPDEGARTATLVRLSAELLGVRDDQVDPDAWLGDLGLDPSGLLELARRIEEELAFAVPPDALAPDGTLRRIAKLAALPRPGAGPDPADLAHTLQVGRTARPYRLAVVADDPATALDRLREALDAFLNGAPPDSAGYVTGGPDDRTTDGTTGRPSPEECAALFRRGRLRELAAAWAAGAEVRWHDLGGHEWGGRDGGPAGRRIPLPTHPLNEESCWLGQWRGGPTGPAAVEDGGGAAEAVRRAASGQEPWPGPELERSSGPERAVAHERAVATAEWATSAEPSTAPGAHAARRTAGPLPMDGPADGPAVETRILDPGIALVVMRTSSNMFTEETVRGLEAAFAELSADDHVKAVVLTGAGPAFSMGGTPEALERLAGGRGSFTDVPFLYEGLLSCDRPVIAALSGHASGGGLMFGLHADMVLMAREGMYAASFLKYGFTPGMGATYVLERRFGRSLATEMFYTGRPFSGAELERRGAQVTFLQRDEVLPAALALARTIASQPSLPVRALKRELADRTLAELHTVITREADLHRRVLGEDAVTRVQHHTAKVRGYAHPRPTPQDATPRPHVPTPSPARADPKPQPWAPLQSPNPTHAGPSPSSPFSAPDADAPTLGSPLNAAQTHASAPDLAPAPSPASALAPSPALAPAQAPASVPASALALASDLAWGLPPAPGLATTGPTPAAGSGLDAASTSAPFLGSGPGAMAPAPVAGSGPDAASAQAPALALDPFPRSGLAATAPPPAAGSGLDAASTSAPFLGPGSGSTTTAPAHAAGSGPDAASARFLGSGLAGPAPAPATDSDLYAVQPPAPGSPSSPGLAPSPPPGPPSAPGPASALGLASPQAPASPSAQAQPLDAAPPAPVVPRQDAEGGSPRPVTPGPQRDVVIAVVMDTLCGHLYLDRNEIDPQLTFSEMGVDSLGAVEIVRDLNQHFGLDLDSVAVYDHPTLDRLADYVVAEFARGRALHAAAVRPHAPAVVEEAPQAPQGPGPEAQYVPAEEPPYVPVAAEEASSAAPGPVASDTAFSQAVPPKTPVGRSSDGPSPDRPTGPAQPPPLLIRPAGPAGPQDGPGVPAGPRPITLTPIRPPAAVAPAPAETPASPTPVGAAAPAQTAQSVKPAEAAPPAQPTEPATPAEAASPVQPATPASPTTPTTPTKPARPARPAPPPAPADIAVIGMSGRFPDAPDLPAFWSNLVAGRGSVREVPAERWDVAEYYDPDRRAEGRTYSKWAALLDDVDRFDAAFFHLSPMEAEQMDPQQRLFLQEAWSALEDAGYAVPGAERASCGVFIGSGAGDYLRLLEENGQDGTGQAFLGNSPSILAARIAYHLNLGGPAVAIDTACSSSLVAVHQAVSSIRSGECDTAVAGGVAVMLTPRMHVWTSSAGMLSPTGRCAPFDASADGIVLGEGVGAVVLKPLDRALADGDTVYAVIKATGSNSDGRTNGITAPSADSQAALLADVYRRAGLSPDEVGYVEAHGTGTALGDPIEVKALTQVFGDRAASAGVCYLGSVKSNIGHTTLASGIAGFIKVVLALRAGRIAPSLNFATPNPKINFERGPFRVATAAMPWPPGPSGMRVGAVSSFGFSGTNAHVVLAEAPPQAASAEGTADEAVVLPLSARTAEALHQRVRQLTGRLTEQHDLGDTARTLALSRAHFPVRAAFVVRNLAELREQAEELLTGGRPPTDTHGEPLRRLAEDYLAGQDVNWTTTHADRPRRNVPLPTYPFARTRHWTVAPATAQPAKSDPTAAPPAARPAPATTAAVRPGEPGTSAAPAVVRPGSSDTSAAPASAGPAEPGPPPAAATARLVPTDTSVVPGTSAASAVAKAAESSASAAPAVVRPQVSCTFTAPGVVGPAGSGPATPPAVVRPVETGASVAPADVQPADSRTSAASAIVLPGAAGPAASPAVADAAAVPAVVTDASAVAVTIADAPTTASVTVTNRPAEPMVVAEVPPDSPVVTDAPAMSPPATPSPDHPLLIRRPAWYEDAAPADRLPGAAGRRVAVACADGGGPLADALAGLHPHDEVIRIALGGATPAPGPFDVLYVLAGSAGAVPELADTAPTGDPVTLAAFYLLKQLLRFGQAARPLAVTFVVHGVLPVTPDDRVLPHGAGLVGLSRTVAAEHPLWRVNCVDVDPNSVAADPSRAARRIVAEDGTHPVVARRGERRYLRRFEPLAREATGPALRHAGVYLVVGGAGGLGRAVSERFAAVHGARLVWLGRRPGDDPEVLAGTAEIVRLGGEIRYVRGDVTDPVAVRAAVARARQDFGALHGALHAAGELRDVPLARMTEADFTRVLAAKAVGTVVLVEALAHERPDFCVLFSSAASFVASPGQANYAAAATLEDAYAWQARGRYDFPVSVVNWGFWGTVGAVSDERYHRSFAALGVGSIDPAEGFSALRTALSSGAGQALVIKADPARLAGHGMPLTTDRAAAVTDPVPATTGDPTSQGNPDPDPDPDLERRARDYLKRVFAGLLKCGEDEITDRETLDNIGVDSLLGAEIIDLLSDDLGELPATLLFEHATIERLATHLLHIRRERLTAVLIRDEDGPAHPAAPVTQPQPQPTDSPDPATVTVTVTGEANPATPPTPPAQGIPDVTLPSHSASAPHDSLDIAVVGVTGRYPGAPDLDAFARNLAAGTSSVTEVPADRWDWRDHFDSRRGRPNRTYGKWAGFLDGIDEFDPQLFGILPREAAAIDPQERLFLETCWNLLEETGYLGEHTRVPETGVFVGLMYGSYGQLAAASGWNRGEFGAAHSAYWSVANRASYVFDLTGPSFAVDSACSSSLTAVHLACESLRRGECRMAVAGGVNLILHPAHLVALAGRGMLASGDACRTFDAGADGYVPGEGVGAVLLKPLAEAKADGDRIWAVIKASRANAGGKTSGYTVPNPNAQAALVARTLEEAGVDPRTVGYVEAHGTGTALGDPIEVVALTHAFGSGSEAAGSAGRNAARGAGWDGPPVTIGSVKANIGHLEGAAGIAGLTKVLLQLRDRTLYPSANLERINPKIDFDGSPFRPLTGAVPWPRPELDLDGRVTAYPRRAGVSSFGAGGANTHLVVEEYLEVDARAIDAGAAPEDHDEVFLLSARTKERLTVLAARVAEHLRHGALAEDVTRTADTTGPSLRSLAWTSQTGRRELTERLAVVARDLPELAEGLRAFAEGRRAPGVHTGTAARTGVPRWQGDDRVEAARAWLAGAEVDWRPLWSGPRPRRAAFPTYPFDRARYWLAEPDDTQDAVRNDVQEAVREDVRQVVQDDAREVVRDAEAEAVRNGAQEVSQSSATPHPAPNPAQHDLPPPPPTPTPEEAALVRFARPAWEHTPLPEPASGTPAPRTALVVAEEPGLAEALTERLAADGVRAVLLTRAEDFARTDDAEDFARTDDAEDFARTDNTGYRLALGYREHCTRLVADLTDRGLEPDALVFCAPENPAGLGSDDLPDSLDRGFHSLAGLTTALLARPGAPRDLRVVFGFTAPTPSSRPYDAAVGAALRTLALEHGRLGAARVAFEGADAVAPPSLRAAALVAELAGCRPGTAAEVRHRNGARQTRVLRDFVPPPTAELRPRPDGVYLITGGAGPLGLHTARLLTSRERVTVLLVGRSELDAWRQDLVDELSRGAGAGEGTVTYLRADVSDAGQAHRLVADAVARYGPLRGVVHAAGVTRDSRAVSKSRADLDAVLAPKTAGAVALDEATAGQPLDFFVLYSSVVAYSGNPGQFDYAYANAFLDEFAEQRAQRHAAGLRTGHTVSIAWPLWADGGMSVDTATRELLARRWDMAPLSTANGLRALDLAVGGQEVRVTVVQRPVPPPESVATPTAAPAVTSVGALAAESTEPAGPVEPPMAELERELRAMTAGFLLVDPQEVELDAQLLELGFDSITLTELINQVNEFYGLDLLPTVLFECPDLASFAAYLGRHHAAETSARHTPTPVAEPTQAPPTASGTGPAQSLPGAAPRPFQVAVVGRAGVMPGSATMEEFWDHLLAGRDLVTGVPEDRTELAGAPGSAGYRGGFLTDVSRFDARFFGIAPREAALMDPQQRLFLETTWRAVWDAGYRPSDLAGTATGLFAGVSTSDYADLLGKDTAPVEAHSASGVAHAILANRVSYLMDLRGPSESVDTACSSSLVALHHAVGALAAGECEQALVGGVNVLLSPALFVSFQQSGMLSPDGRCKTFDAAADGYVRGEGCGVVLLKPLDRALADGDHVYGVVAGTAVGHGGRSGSLTAPNPEAQARVLVQAHRAAGTDPDLLGYLEAHGTGTSLGDPVEIEGVKQALTTLYADRGRELPDRPHIAIGSVKTNIGHLEAAAGIAGVLKVLLAMEHGQLPPHLHLDRLNPHIRLDGTPLRIVEGPVRWDGLAGADGVPVRRAGVSSFGFGGTNSHVVLESYVPEPAAADDGSPRLMVVSAPSAVQLERYADLLADHLERREPALASVARTLQTGREECPERLALVVRDRAELVRGLRSAARGVCPAGAHRGTARQGAPAAEAYGDLDRLARAWVEGSEVDWSRLWTGPLPRRTPLPAVPFAGVRHWFAPGAPQPILEATIAASPSSPSSSFRERVKLAPLGGAVEPAERHVPVRLPAPDPVSTTVMSAPRTLPPTPTTPGPTTPRPGAPLDEVRRTVTTLLSDILGTPEEELSADQSFSELGLDSIFRMDLVRLLNETYGLDLKAVELYERDSVDRLSTAVAAAFGSPAITPNLTEHQLVLFVEATAERPVEAGTAFADQGFTSFDMLRVVSALERRFGPQRKSLLFDHPTVGALADHLSTAHGARAEDLTPDQIDTLATDLAAEPPTDGPVVVRKRELESRPEIAEVIAELDRRHAKEGGLPGRDIAPLIFLGSARRAYFNFSQREGALLAWSYVGSEEDLPELTAEYTDHAERHGLKPNLLSMIRLEEAGGRPFSATPFGVVQRMQDIQEFTLSGPRMRRLRYMVQRFERMPGVSVAEYRVGSDPATDTAIAGLIQDWCATKDMVNPYVFTVRDEISRGLLAERHRMFLTYAGNTLRSAVIVTRIPSENGYLLDLEFYSEQTPMGGLEFTIVEIVRLLAAEGRTMFSFGASLGVRLCSSDNADPVAEQALTELRSTGVFTGEGNFRFKNKFRPVNLPVYLCRPSDAEPTDVGELILMIANPDVSAARLPAAPRATQPTPVPEPLPQAVPHTFTGAGTSTEAATTTPPDTQAVALRERRLAAHGYNPLLLGSGEADFDLVTDSWTELDTPYVAEGTAALRAQATARGGPAEDLAGLVPFRYVVPTLRGRSAEALLCRAWPGRRGLVVQNELFPTWALHQVDHGFVPLTVRTAATPDGPPVFRADLDVDALDGALAAHPGGVSFVCVETSTNALGGHPLSLANLRRIRAVADAHRVPLVLDATRVLENAAFVAAHEDGERGRKMWEVAEEILGLATAVTLGLSKDHGIDLGGIVATDDSALAALLHEDVLRRGAEPGVAQRRLIAAALADRERSAGLVAGRMEAVRRLRKVLADAGLPVREAGGHCVLLDAARMPGADRSAHPVAGQLSWIYRHTGIRAAPHLAGGPDATLIRLAVPVGLGAEGAGEAGRRLAALYRDGVPAPELVPVDARSAAEHPATAAYHPAATIPADVRAAMDEGHQPLNENLAVLREHQPEVRRHLVPLSEGDVEVFTAGEGTPLVLLHPFNIGAGFFGPQFAGLADRHRVISVHHSGVGSTTAAADLSVEGLAELLRRTLDALDVREPVHLAGASFGALPALSFALRHPREAASLTLIGGSYKVGNRQGEMNRLALVAREDFDRLLTQPGTEPIAAHRQRYEDTLLRCESLNAQIGLRYLDEFDASPNLLPQLAGLPVPSLIAHGRHDTVVPLKTAHLLHGTLPDVRYHEFEEAGHFPSLTAAPRFNELLAGFLAEVDATGRTEGGR